PRRRFQSSARRVSRRGGWGAAGGRTVGGLAFTDAIVRRRGAAVESGAGERGGKVATAVASGGRLPERRAQDARTALPKPGICVRFSFATVMTDSGQSPHEGRSVPRPGGRAKGLRRIHVLPFIIGGDHTWLHAIHSAIPWPSRCSRRSPPWPCRRSPRSPRRGSGRTKRRPWPPSR